MEKLLPIAGKIAAVLKQRHETVGVAESTTGGLISAALLAIPGASTYFVGGGVVYTLVARRKLLELPDSAFAGIKSVIPEGALILARAARERLSVTWSISEIGASGPTGNRYGDPAGHSCLAVAGPVERAITVETASADRVANMYAFATAGLELLAQCLSENR